MTVIAADPNCPACHGSGIDPDSEPMYHDGAPGIPDPAGYEPCDCIIIQLEAQTEAGRPAPPDPADYCGECGLSLTRCHAWNYGDHRTEDLL